MDEKFLKVKEHRARNRDKIASRLAGYEEKLSKTEPGTREYDAYSQIVRDTARSLRVADEIIEFMRPDNENDVINRADIQKNYPTAIKKTIPADTPVVFHGTQSIGTVREILRTGGLLTPEQRGVSMTSFANAIDVTYKDNISVSCQFADGGTYMPYGAIFAFVPEEGEVEKVVSTGDSTEVAGGVNGVNFRDEPKRLVGIISTDENIDKIKEWCEKYGVDASKVRTHKEFVDFCKKTMVINSEKE